MNLRVELDDFCPQLLKDQNLVVGRLDGRITGPPTSGSLDDGTSDPSDAAFMLAYGDAINDYINRELGFVTDSPYIPSNSEINHIWALPVDVTTGGYLSQETTIYELMSKNPFLKIWVLCGYYDGATAFYAAEWVYNHVFLNDEYKDNLSFTYYPSGHMIYMVKDAFDQLRKDAQAWYEQE